MSTSGSPLRVVLEEFEAGTRSLDLIAKQTGLRRDLVQAIVDHLLRTGHLRAEMLSFGCPAQGCGGCPVRAGCAVAASPGAPAATKRPGRSDGGLVALSLPVARGKGARERRVIGSWDPHPKRPDPAPQEADLHQTRVLGP